MISQIKKLLLMTCALLVFTLMTGCAVSPMPTLTVPPQTTAPAESTATAAPTEIAGGEEYEQSNQPFESEEIYTLFSGFETVQDYIDFLSPINYSWHYLGDATGETQIYMDTLSGTLSVIVYREDGEFAQESDPLGNAQLPEDSLELSAHLASIEWCDVDYVIPYIRDVALGDPLEKVLAAFLNNSDGSDNILYDATAINAAAQGEYDDYMIGGRIIEEKNPDIYYRLAVPYVEYNWSNKAFEKDAWGTYWSLYYEIDYQNQVSLIFLEYTTDPE